jgi:hypothetical protein
MHKTLEVTSFNTSYQLGVSRGAENLLSSDSRFNTYEDYETTGYAYVHVKGTSGNKGTIPFKSAETALEFVNHFAQLVHNYTDNLSQLDADIQDMRGLLWECRNLTPEDFGHSEILARLASFEEREWRVIFPQNLEDFLSFAHGNISLNRAR